MFQENTKDFGKDLGLMHQVVILSRKHQIGQRFWGFLAHNDAFFKKVVEMATEEARLKPEDIRDVIEYLKIMCSKKCMIREEESYYARSSHSNHRGLIHVQMNNFKNLVTRAQHSPAAAELCAELEKFFQIAYVNSAVYCQINETPQNGGQWFHKPIYGLHTTFMDLWEGDDRVYLGTFLDHEAFTSDMHIKEFHALWKAIDAEWEQTRTTEKNPELDLTLEQLQKLLTGSNCCLNEIYNDIHKKISSVT